MSQPTPPHAPARLTAGQDVRLPEPVDPDAAQGIVEVIEVVPAPPERLGVSDEVGDSPLTPSNFTVEVVNEPLYQAFLATGFFRPR